MDTTMNALHKGYASGCLNVIDVLDWALSRLGDRDQENVWISTVEPDAARQAASQLDARRDQMANLPLYGTLFSVKDNIDVAGQPTTAACPQFSYVASQSAHVVDAAVRAGAIYLGKTNMDQFATGLVGNRSPYGTPRNPHNPAYLPGGSSSGAAVSVATGVVSFGFGTDTGGSGRIPACYNGVVGLKPAPGTLSRQGLVYACQSFDTPSIYASNVGDAMAAFAATSAKDPHDHWSSGVVGDQKVAALSDLRIATPCADALKFFGSTETEQLFHHALGQLHHLVRSVERFDYAPFDEIGQMMFFGPFVAERYASVGQFVEQHPDACDPTVRDIVLASNRFSAADAYQSMYRIQQVRAELTPFWERHDLIVVPTVGRLYTLAEAQADAYGPSFANGYYTNFANPLGMSALAVPYGQISAGVPYGVTFLAPAGREQLLSEVAKGFLNQTSRNLDMKIELV